MTASIVALAVASVSGYQASGIPSCIGGGTSVRVLIQSVKFNITDDGVDVTSMTLFKSDSDKPVSCTLAIPGAMSDSGDALAPSDFHARWDKRSLSLASSGESSTMGSAWAKVSFEAHGTHALRMSFRVQPARTGYESKQRTIVYGLGGSQTWSGSVEKFDVAFTYTQKQVFGLPDISPKWDWQVGRTGAFIRRENFSAGDGAIAFTYYPGGF